MSSSLYDDKNRRFVYMITLKNLSFFIVLKGNSAFASFPMEIMVLPTPFANHL